MSITKVSYSMISGAAVNAIDYGIDITGATDSSSAIEAAATALGTYGTILLPAGTIAFNFDFAGRRINFVGLGMNATNVKSYASGEAAFKFSGNATWDMTGISDLTLTGNGTRADIGVAFGSDPYVTNDQYAGRVIFSRVKFDNLDKGVLKRYGNIGNVFNECVFSDCNFHYHATGQSSPLMHAGADAFYACHFAAAQLASIYVNSPVSGSGGLYFDPRCIFELNPGFLLFCKSMAGVWMPGIVFDGCWNESNATASSITIDSVAYTPCDFYLNTARQVSARNMRITKLEMVAATLLCTNCNLDGITLVKDSASSIVSDRQQADTFINTAVYTASLQHAIRPSGNTGSFFWSKPRNKLTRGWTALQHQTFAEGAVTFTGTGSIVANQVADGQLFDSCVELALPSGNTEYATGVKMLSADKWIVSTIDIKLVSGAADSMFKIENLTNSITIDNTHWKTLVSLTNTIGAGGANIRPRVIGGSGTANIRFSAYQTVEFITLQEAISFLDELLYIAPSTFPRTIYQTSAPTTGTWNVGDICINRTPSVGVPKGWRCTVAGTPGTWVSEGNL